MPPRGVAGRLGSPLPRATSCSPPWVARLDPPEGGRRGKAGPCWERPQAKFLEAGNGLPWETSLSPWVPGDH